MPKPAELTGLMLPDRAYWVVPGRFMAGAYPGSKDADEALRKGKRLLDRGIRHVISLMEVHEVGHFGERFVPYDEFLSGLAKDRSTGVSFIRFPIRDMDVPTSKTMTAILDKIDQAMAAGQAVYVHCWGGRGRTGTVVGCYLVRQGLQGEDALRRITELRGDLPDAHNPSPETEAQRQMVRRWKG